MRVIGHREWGVGQQFALWMTSPAALCGRNGSLAKNASVLRQTSSPATQGRGGLAPKCELRAVGPGRRRTWALAGILCLAAAGACPGFSLWDWIVDRPPATRLERELFQGIRYTRDARRAPRPLMIHVMRIDLDAPGLRFLVTPGDSSRGLEVRAATTLEFAQHYHPQIAINGTAWTPCWWKTYTVNDFYPHSGDPVNVHSVAISRGRKYSDAESDWPVLCFTGTQACIVEGAFPPGTHEALAGAPLLIRNGVVEDDLSEPDEPAPRTAAALDRTARTLWLIVVDGRQPRYSEGMTLRELANLLLSLGAWNALNFDGGGSSTLVAQQDGEWQVLNSPIHTGIPRRQRPVANHLGVYASPGAGKPRRAQ